MLGELNMSVSMLMPSNTDTVLDSRILNASKTFKSTFPSVLPSFYTLTLFHLQATNPAFSSLSHYLAHLQHTHTQMQPTYTLPKPRALLRQQQ